MNIRIEKVSKQFGSVWALEEVSLELEAGQVVVVLGANGAGKTTVGTHNRCVKRKDRTYDHRI